MHNSDEFLAVSGREVLKFSTILNNETDKSGANILNDSLDDCWYSDQVFDVLMLAKYKIYADPKENAYRFFFREALNIYT